MSRKIVIFTILIFMSLIFLGQNNDLKVEKGVLDLRGYDFNENVKLEGEWEFYWNKFLDYYDFENKVYTPDAYYNAPGSWSGISVDGKEIPDTGYATLRIVIFVDQYNSQNYLIRFGEILTAYKVWWNNGVLTEIGRVAENSDEAIPAMKPLLKSIEFEDEKIQLIIQISNYNHRTNGLFDVPIIGEESKMLKATSLDFFVNLFLFGLMIIMSFYHLGLFVLRRKNKAALAFSLLSFIVAVRTLFSGNYALNYLFDISWEIVYRINYFTLYGMVTSFIFFFQTTFEEQKYKWYFYGSYGISGVFAMSLFFPTIIYTKFLLPYQLAVVLMIIFSFYLLFKYIKAKKTGAIVLTITIAIFFACGINDILYFNNIIKSTTLTHVGLFALILGQSLTLARIFTKSFTHNETLTAKLDYQNQHLQELVEERTKEINSQKQDILQKNEELIVQKEELQVQKEEILTQKELLEEHNKLMTDSVNYASTIQQAVLPSHSDITKYFNSFIIYLPKDIVSGDFYWFNETNPKYLYFIVGDCTGHGVPGSFISLIVMYLLNSVVNELQINKPNEILTELDVKFNKFLHKGQNSNRDGVVLGVMRFEKDNLSKLTYSAAKTNLFIYDKSIDKLDRNKGTRRTIGYSQKPHGAPTVEFENFEFEIKETQTLYCSTDGFVDQNNSERKRFGTTKFLEMLNKNAKLPMQQQKVLYIKELNNYMGNEKQRDDITFIGITPKLS